MAAVHSHLLHVVAYIGEYESALRSHIDGVVAVYVSGRTHTCAFGKNTCTDKRLTRGVGNGAAHSD